jgi:hypothetical protein
MMAEQTEHFTTEALDVLHEWMRRVAVPTDHPPELEDQRVVWTTPGVFHLEDQWGTRQGGDYRVTVLVEPAESWRQVTWYDVALCTPEDARPLISLGGVEAVVLSAVAQRWHVRPGTGDSKWNPPIPEEHDVVMVKLQVAGKEPRMYTMPPSGPVMMLVGSPVGPAVSALLTGLGPVEAVQDGQ